MLFHKINLKLSIAYLVICFCGTIAIANTPDQQTKGYNCLFMGHSFFAPIAKAFDSHPARAGFTEHQQTVVFRGGPNGSPAALWNNRSSQVEDAKSALKSGEIDLLALTYYPLMSSIDDYRKWIDLALENNKKTIIVIHFPWPRYMDRTLEQYEFMNRLKLSYLIWVMKELKEQYPGTDFRCIQQGRWMIGLWKAFEEGKLAEISVVKRAGWRDRNKCLFRDTLGHGGKIPIELGALLWLATIYEVDLEKYEWDTNVGFDVKKLAKEIYQSKPTDIELSKTDRMKN